MHGDRCIVELLFPFLLFVDRLYAELAKVLFFGWAPNGVPGPLEGR